MKLAGTTSSLHPVPRRQRRRNQPRYWPKLNKLQAEAEALKTAATYIEVSTHPSHSVVLLMDALSILQSLQSNWDTDHNGLSAPFAEAMQSPCNGYHPTATCLARRLPTLWQRRAQQKSKWVGLPATLRWRPSRRSNTARGMSTHDTTKLTPNLLTRREQVTVFRLRTGHNCLSYHLYSKLHIGHTEQCPCGTGSQTTEHLF